MIKLQLRGITPEQIGIMTAAHNDVLEWCRILLRNRNVAIWEEALYRSGRLQYRKYIQWPAIKEELDAEFKCKLLAIPRSQFREQIASKDNPLRVLQHVKEHLSKGNGNETAGYAYADWNSAITERQIASRRHVATGFHNSATELQMEMQQREQLAQVARDAGKEE